MFEFRIVEPAGLLIFKISGILSTADVEVFNAQMRLNVAKARHRFGLVKIMGDVMSAPVQPMDIAQRLDPPSQYLTGAGDRYAIVVASTLLKMQAGRIIDDARAKTFHSITEAEEWLSVNR